MRIKSVLQLHFNAHRGWKRGKKNKIAHSNVMIHVVHANRNSFNSVVIIMIMVRDIVRETVTGTVVSTTEATGIEAGVEAGTET
jgi:hypothetical protein